MSSDRSSDRLPFLNHPVTVFKTGRLNHEIWPVYEQSMYCSVNVLLQSQVGVYILFLLGIAVIPFFADPDEIIVPYYIILVKLDVVLILIWLGVRQCEYFYAQAYDELTYSYSIINGDLTVKVQSQLRRVIDFSVIRSPHLITRIDAKKSNTVGSPVESYYVYYLKRGNLPACKHIHPYIHDILVQVMEQNHINL